MFYGAHFSFKIHFVQRTSHDLSPGAGGEDFGRDRDGTEKELVVGTENIGRTTVNGLPTNCQSGRGGGTSENIAKPYEGIRSIFSGRNQNLPTPLPPPPRINNDRSLSDLV